MTITFRGRHAGIETSERTQLLLASCKSSSASAAAGTTRAYKIGAGSRTQEQGPGVLEYKATSVCGFHQY